MSVPAGSSALGPVSLFMHQTVKGNPLIVGSGAPPVPVASALKGGVTGVAYSESVTAQGGASPYTFSVTLGAMPASLALNATTGVISGTPTVAATSTFTVKVVDTNGNSGTQQFTIVIAAPSGGNGSFVFIG